MHSCCIQLQCTSLSSGACRRWRSGLLPGCVCCSRISADSLWSMSQCQTKLPAPSCGLTSPAPALACCRRISADDFVSMSQCQAENGDFEQILPTEDLQAIFKRITETEIKVRAAAWACLPARQLQRSIGREPTACRLVCLGARCILCVPPAAGGGRGGRGGGGGGGRQARARGSQGRQLAAGQAGGGGGRDAGGPRAWVWCRGGSGAAREPGRLGTSGSCRSLGLPRACLSPSTCPPPPPLCARWCCPSGREPLGTSSTEWMWSAGGG